MKMFTEEELQGTAKNEATDSFTGDHGDDHVRDTRAHHQIGLSTGSRPAAEGSSPPREGKKSQQPRVLFLLRHPGLWLEGWVVERESQKISASEGITVFPHGEHQGPWSPVVCAVWFLPLTAAELGCSLSAPVRGAPPHWAPLGLLKKSLVTDGRQVYLAVSVHTPTPSLGSLWVLPGCQPPAPRWSFSPAGPCSSQSQAIDMVDLIREVLLALLG